MGICCIFVGISSCVSDIFLTLVVSMLYDWFDTTPFILYKVLLPPRSLRPTNILALHLLNFHHCCLYKWPCENNHFIVLEIYIRHISSMQQAQAQSYLCQQSRVQSSIYTYVMAHCNTGYCTTLLIKMQPLRDSSVDVGRQG